MTGDSIFKYPATIGYLVRRIRQKHSTRQVGKTIVQKMMYLFGLEQSVDLGYSMHHYGPYSARVAGDLDFAREADILTITWVDEQGNFIEEGSNFAEFEFFVDEKDKEVIDGLVDKYAHFSAIDLSIIATAFFLRDKFQTADENLATIVHKVKPSYELGSIERILKTARVIEE
jgi:uncharacterized protein YwgA